MAVVWEEAGGEAGEPDLHLVWLQRLWMLCEKKEDPENRGIKVKQLNVRAGCHLSFTCMYRLPFHTGRQWLCLCCESWNKLKSKQQLKTAISCHVSWAMVEEVGRVGSMDSSSSQTSVHPCSRSLAHWCVWVAEKWWKAKWTGINEMAPLNISFYQNRWIQALNRINRPIITMCTWHHRLVRFQLRLLW